MFNCICNNWWVPWLALMVIEYAIYSRQQLRRLSVCIFDDLYSYSHSHSHTQPCSHFWFVFALVNETSGAVRYSCVPHDYFWPKTDKWKKTCRIYYYDTETTCRAFCGCQRCHKRSMGCPINFCFYGAGKAQQIAQQLRHTFRLFLAASLIQFTL